jgi:hypothetical protein
MATIKAGPNHPAFRGAAGEEMLAAVNAYVGLHPADGRITQARQLCMERAPRWDGKFVMPDLAKWGLEQGPTEHWQRKP